MGWVEREGARVRREVDELARTARLSPREALEAYLSPSVTVAPAPWGFPLCVRRPDGGAVLFLPEPANDEDFQHEAAHALITTGLGRLLVRWRAPTGPLQLRKDEATAERWRAGFDAGE